MRAAGIETFGGEVQMLELAAPQSLAPDEVVADGDDEAGRLDPEHQRGLAAD
jgi:hypothetical protein